MYLSAISLLLTYLGYNLIAGLVLSLHYLGVEGGVTDGSELTQLIFFPTSGLGKWKYNRLLRIGVTPEFPERWYILKYRIPLNWGLIISLGVVVGICLLAFGGLLGQTDKADNAGELVVGLLADIGVAILFFLFSVIAFLGFFFLRMILITPAKEEMKRIEANQEMQRLREENERLKNR